MNLKEAIECGGILLLLMTVVQIAPIKVNPWSWMARLLKKGMTAFGRAFNTEILNELAEIKESQAETKKELDKHIKVDDERHADDLRAAILRFNVELLRNISHTHEDFVEVLYKIDEYEAYCKNHDEYKNSRAVYAIANIKRVYTERLKKRDFAQYEREEKKYGYEQAESRQ